MDKETCIICRKKPVAPNQLSDEHIIPDAIGGRIHSYRVCKDCNSMLGQKVDPLLVGHCIIQFARFIHRIPGKSKTVPNPFSGIYIGDDGKKYRIEDHDGKLVPHLLPEKMEEKDGVIHTVVDVADEKNIKKSVEKYCDRNGLEIKDMKQETVTAKGPKFNIPMEVDLRNFKLALLKIGYEYAIERIENYYDDPLAVKIADILHNADVSRLNEITFCGSGFDNKDLLDKFIDNSDNDKHIILLTNSRDKMFVYINIFNSICIPIQLSDRTYPELNGGFVCVNNSITKTTYEKELFKLLEDISVTKVELYDDKGLFISPPYLVQAKTNSPIIFDSNKSNPITAYDMVLVDYLKYEVERMKNDDIEGRFEYDVTDDCYVNCKDIGFVKIKKIVVVHEINKI